jgi:hypothetical protein
MHLNKKKSAVMIYKDPFKDQNDNPNRSILGIPVVRKYKYLGITLNDELNLKDHFSHMRKKVNFIKSKLFFVFRKSSIRFRRNCFEVFVCPLFHQLVPFLYYGRATDKAIAHRLWKVQLKKFLNLKINTNDEDLRCFQPYDFINKLKTDFARHQPMIQSRQGELLDVSIQNKQKILREPSSDFKQLIRKDPHNEITTILNMIGKKLVNNRRITRNALITYFEMPLQQVIKSVPEPFESASNTTSEILQNRSIFQKKVDNIRKTRKDSGPDGVYRLITPLPPPNRRAANGGFNHGQNHDRNPNDDDNISHLSMLRANSQATEQSASSLY